MIDSFGAFNFADAPSDQIVVITIVSRKYLFNPQVISLTENATGIELQALSD